MISSTVSIKFMRKFILITIFITVVLGCNLAEAVNWPLRIHSGGMYLEDQSGVPFPIIGDAAWSAIVMLNHTDLATYLNDRQNKGFTAIVMNAIEHKFCNNAPADIYGNVPFTNGENNWSVRNESYWLNVDYVLNQAKSRNMVVILAPAYLGYGCGDEGWCANMQAQSDSAMTSYGNWIGSRYANQGNIIWLNAVDANCADYPNACARVNDIANGIKATNLCLHTAEGAREEAAMDDYNQSWLDLNTVYCTNTDVDLNTKTQYQRTGAKPFFLIEAYYENEHSTTVIDWQNQELIPILGGAFGFVFGNCPIWGFNTTAMSGFCDNNTRTWQGSLSLAGSTTTSYIGKLMQSRKWWGLVPDYSNTAVTSPKGSGISYHATARVSTGETVMVWCPSTNQVTVDMTKISGSQAMAWWWNPDDNSSSLIGTYNTTGTHNFTPSSARKVLVLDDASKNLAAPGTTVYSIDKIPPSPPTNLRIISQ